MVNTRKVFSDDPEIWYLSGIWAWLTAIVVFVILSFSSGIFGYFVLASAIGYAVWLFWPVVAYSIMKTYQSA